MLTQLNNTIFQQDHYIPLFGEHDSRFDNFNFTDFYLKNKMTRYKYLNFALPPIEENNFYQLFGTTINVYVPTPDNYMSQIYHNDGKRTHLCVNPPCVDIEYKTIWSPLGISNVPILRITLPAIYQNVDQNITIW